MGAAILNLLIPHNPLPLSHWSAGPSIKVFRAAIGPSGRPIPFELGDRAIPLDAPAVNQIRRPPIGPYP